MSIRRVVAATINGRSGVISDEVGLENAFRSVPGFNPVILGATMIANTELTNGGYMAGTSCVPKPGGTSLLMVTFPPDKVMASPTFDGQLAGEEYLNRLPGLAEAFEPDNPGMHRTPTIDYAIVFDGEIVCEFDNGEVNLARGDVLINHATRHAWRNRSDEPATMIFVLAGCVD
jgi:hypothetical protein